MLNRLRQLAKWSIEIEIIMFRQPFQDGPEKYLSLLLPRKDSPFVYRKRWIRNDEIRVNITLCSQSTAGRTGTHRTVEREHPGCDLGKTESAMNARKLLTE